MKKRIGFMKMSVAIILSVSFILSPLLSNFPIGKDQVAVAAKNKYTGWKYWGTLKYSKKFQKFTVGSMSIIISGIIPWAKVKTATQIASLYYSIHGSNAYITQVTYRNYLKGAHGSLLPVEEKTITYFYSDKNRKKLLNQLHM